MNVLALDCSGDILAVCCAKIPESGNRTPEKQKHPYKDELGHKQIPENSFIELSIDAGYRHTERLMEAVDYCVREAGLDPSGLDLLACAGGPGSFTGLRIGLSTVKGLSMGLNKPFVCIPTLDAIARDWLGAAPVIVPVIDAKRSHFYFAVYEGTRLASGPFDRDMEYLLKLAQNYSEVLFVGPDADMLATSIEERSGFRLAQGHRRSSVKSMALMAPEVLHKKGPASQTQGLLYLRSSDAEEAKAKAESFPNRQ